MKKVILIKILLLLSLSVNCQSFNQSVDSMINFKRYDFKKLNIISSIHDSTDCGEWGGHTERITIYKSDGILWVYYTRDPNNCEMAMGVPQRKNEIRQEYRDTLTSIKQDYVKVYLRDLIKHTPDKWKMSNAPNCYEVKFTNGFFTYGFRIDDNDISWKKYEPFRNNLIK